MACCRERGDLGGWIRHLRRLDGQPRQPEDPQDPLVRDIGAVREPALDNEGHRPEDQPGERRLKIF